MIGGDGADDDRLIAAAQGADVFVMECAPRRIWAMRHGAASPWSRKRQVIWQYHIKPRDLARIATAAKVKTLVLYHVQNYSDPYDPEAVLKEVREYYDGTVVQARDGDIF